MGLIEETKCSHLQGMGRVNEVTSQQTTLQMENVQCRGCHDDLVTPNSDFVGAVTSLVCESRGYTRAPNRSMPPPWPARMPK